MKVRFARNALLVFGAAPVGVWVGWLLFVPVFTMLGLGKSKVYTGGEAKLHLVLVSLAGGMPHLVGAGLAGLVLGYVTQGAPFRPWAIGLVTVFVTITYGPALALGSFFAGTAGPLLHSLELVGTCVLAPVGLWLGRYMTTNDPPA